MPGLLIHGARQVLTLRGASSPRRGSALQHLSIIEDGSILIEDGRIRDVGPTRRIENLAAARSARQISARGRVVMPGFVDSHMQLVCSRDTQVIRRTPAWRLSDDAAALLRRCLRYGTTSLDVKCCLSLDETSSLKVLKLLADLAVMQPIHLVSTYCGGATPPSSFDSVTEALALRVLAMSKDRRLASFVALNQNLSSEILAAARRLGLGIKIHADALDGCDLADAVTVEHLEHISSADIGRLSQAAAVAVLMPGFGFHGEDRGFAPARELISQGVAVALASGYDRELNPSFSMPITVELACRKLGMAPSEAIVAATLNGAYAVGRGATTGSLEPGKDADILILETPDYRDLAYETGVNPVDIAIVQGEVVCQNSVSYGAVAL